MPASLFFTFAGNLSLTANGDITESNTNALSVDGNASFTSLTGNVIIGNTLNSFLGDVSASVTGNNSIQLDNSNTTTTLGTIHLGTGNFTLNDDSVGNTNITEDPAGNGIITGTPSPGTAQIVVNINNNSTADVLLNTVANQIASAYAVQINGQTTNMPTGSTGDFGYRSTSPGAGLSQLTLNNFTVNNLTLEFDDPGVSIDLGSLPAANGNVAVTVGGDITDNGPLTFSNDLSAAAGGTLTISAALNVEGDFTATAGTSISIGAALSVQSNFTATAGTDIGQSAAVNVGTTISETAGGSISQTAAGVITADTGTFTATGAAGGISLAVVPNDITGAVSLNTPAATGMGSVAYAGSEAVVLGSSSLGTNAFSITAGGSGGITEELGATITQSPGAGQVSLTAGPTGTTIDLSPGMQNLFTGLVTFTGSAVTTVGLEDANPLATLNSVSLSGVPNLANLTLIFDGAAASYQLPTTPLAYTLDLIEENNIVLPVTSSLTVTGSNSLTLESLAGSIQLFGAVNVPGTLTLQTDGFGAGSIQVANPATVFGMLALNSTTSGSDTIAVAAPVTLGNSSLAGTGSLSVTSGGAIGQAGGTSLTVDGPASFTSGGSISLNANNNLFSGVISAAVTGSSSVTLTNANVTTTLGTIALVAPSGTAGTFTLNDSYGGTGSTIMESAAATGIFTTGSVVINIDSDTGANVDLAGAPNLLLPPPLSITPPTVTITGASGGTTGDLGFRNASPLASTGKVILHSFTIKSLTLALDFTAINFDGSLAPSSTGNIILIAGGNITQTAPIVTAGTASFSIGGFVGDSSIILDNACNQIATGANSTIAFNAPMADNKQTVSLFNQGDIKLGACTLGLATVSLTSTNGNILSDTTISQAPGGGAVTLTAGGNTISLTLGQFTADAFYGPVAFKGTGAGGLTTIGFANDNPLATLPAFTGLAATLTSVTFDLIGAPIALGTLNTAALDVEAGGNITQQSATTLTVTGEASFSTSAFAIQLANSNNIAEVALANSGQNPVAVTTTGPLILDNVAVGSGPLTIDAGGAITQTGAGSVQQTLAGLHNVVAGTATFAAPGNPVLLDNATNQILGPVAATASLLTLANSDNVTLGTVDLTGAFTVNSGAGSITQAPGTSFNVGSSAFFSTSFSGAANAITLDNPGNEIAGPIAISSIGAGADIALTGSVQFAVCNVAGQLSVATTGPLNAANISQLLGLSGSNNGTINAMGASFTTTHGSITLQNAANDFNDQPVTLSATAGVSLTDNDAAGLTLGPVNCGAGGLTLTATAAITQASGAITGNGNAGVTIAAASANPASAIDVTLNQAGNDVTGSGLFALTNVANVTLVNQGNLEVSGSIATTANVSLTAGGLVTLPSGTAGTLTLGSLTVSANAIQVGTGGANLTTTDATGIRLTGAITFETGVTLDTSAALGGGAIVLLGNVTYAGNGQTVTFNLPADGRLEYGSGTWNSQADSITVNGTDATFTVDSNATLAVALGMVTLRGTPAAGGSPSLQNALNIDGTLKVSGNALVSDGGSDSIVAISFEAPGGLAVALGNASDGLLTLSGANASDRISIGTGAAHRLRRRRHRRPHPRRGRRRQHHRHLRQPDGRERQLPDRHRHRQRDLRPHRRGDHADLNVRIRPDQRGTRH